jgi:hypothetical protein
MESIIRLANNHALRFTSKLARLSTHQPKTTFISLNTKYALAIEWIKSLGVNIAKNSRVIAYKNCFLTCHDLQCDGATATEILEQKNVSAAIHDGYKFIACFMHLQKLNAIDQQSIDCFTKAVNGPHCYTDEHGENGKSRNYLFELLCSTLFYNKNSNFIFGKNESGDITPTLIITQAILKKKIQLMVECKRIQSEKKIVARLYEAAKQATARVSRCKAGLSYGVICLDITKIINPNNSIDFCKDKFSSVITSNKYEDAIINLRNKYSKDIGKLYEKHPDLTGIIFHGFCLMTMPNFQVPTAVMTNLFLQRQTNIIHICEKIVIDEIQRALQTSHLDI